MGKFTEWLVCPICGAAKEDFEENISLETKAKASPLNEIDISDSKELSYADMSVLLSNLSKGFSKQYLSEESDLCSQLSNYYNSKIELDKDKGFDDIYDLINNDLSEGFINANKIALNNMDRGALRALLWGEKVSKLIRSLLQRYKKSQNSIIKDTSIHVCEICGFIYVGDKLPDVCPVCKVPNFKLAKIQRR